MKQKHNAGFSLIEVMVAIVLLGILVVPTCTSLLMAIRMNARTEEIMQTKLAVSSAVEILMAEGISHESETYDMIEVEVDYNGIKGEELVDRFTDVTVTTRIAKTEDNEEPYYEVTVASNDGFVSVTTYIRSVDPAQTEPEDAGEGA